MSIFDTDYLSPESTLRLKSGEDFALEEQAAAILAKSREGITALTEKRDWLSRDQLLNRYQHEVSNANGICDESLMSGIFRRAFNPLAGHRPRGTRNYDEG